jgi:hypothetical protein
MVAHPHPRPIPAVRAGRLHWARLPFVAAAVAAVCAIDTSWKSAAVAAGHGALDVPASAARPLVTLAVAAAAIAAVLLAPWCCVPGALLVVCGVSSNLLSLALWRAVPNPIGVHLAGGILHFNLADVCVTGGGALFAAAMLRLLSQAPAERLA